MLYRFREIFIATVILFGVASLISMIPIKFEFVKPVRQELEDFDIYDLFYTGKAGEHTGGKDPNIVIIQAAYSRDSINSQINKIKSLEPAVIGIDLSFKGPSNNAPVDTQLIHSIISNDTIVAGYSLDEISKNIIEKLIPRDSLLQNGGYINFSHTDSNSVIRTFAPFYQNAGNRYMAFTTRIVQKYSPRKFDTLEMRGKDIEFINYYGNLEYYTNYTLEEFNYYAKSNQLQDIKGKIVLLGSFSKESDPVKMLEDIKFSPLNEKSNGRGFPDIYGVVIHANILTMILNKSYIKAPSIWLSYLITFWVCFLITWCIFYWHKKYVHPSHIRLFILQVVLILLLVYLALKCYDWFSLRVDLLFMILATVICIEMFDIYIKIATWLNRRWGYRTIFSKHN